VKRCRVLSNYEALTWSASLQCLVT